MSEAIQITNDFDKAMTEFKKVTDTTNLSLGDYTEELGQLGEATARTTTQMLQSATEFSKAGFTPEDSAQLAQVAMLYSNIADAELTAGESASFIISQMKAFNIEASNATSIIDKVNEVKLLLTSINCVNFWKAKTYIVSC
jgi:TP901 family phage tail tape measure protein